jgi:hypothetical protein
MFTIFLETYHFLYSKVPCDDTSNLRYSMLHSLHALQHQSDLVKRLTEFVSLMVPIQ